MSVGTEDAHACLDPVSRKRHPTVSRDYRSVVLTSHDEGLDLCQVQGERLHGHMHSLHISMDDALIYMLHRAHAWAAWGKDYEDEGWVSTISPGSRTNLETLLQHVGVQRCVFLKGQRSTVATIPFNMYKSDFPKPSENCFLQNFFGP